MARGRPLIGIALDSGGAMGGAHVGVLEVLDENGLTPEIIVGSSAGAAVGAIYAAGRLAEFKSLITDMSFIKSLSLYVDPVFPYSGLLAGKKARTFIESLTGDILIEDLPVRYVAVATDLLSGETVAVDRGSLTDAVLASISIPGIFRPVVHMGRLLTDGGVADPLPLDVLKVYNPGITVACNLHSRMTTRYSPSHRLKLVEAERKASESEEDLASAVVRRFMGLLNARGLHLAQTDGGDAARTGKSPADAVFDADILKGLKGYLSQKAQRINELRGSFFREPQDEWRMNILEIILSTTNIQQFQKNRLMLKYEPPDVLIEPDVVDIATLEFNRSAYAVEEGRKKALEAIPAIRSLARQRGLIT
jgi:predicted acylesterase/phospholipase RssA